MTPAVAGPTPRRRAPGWLRAAIWLLAAVAVVVTLRGRTPDPAEVLTMIGAADLRWMAGAVLAQGVSQAAFAGQQQALLAALGIRLPHGDALTITYSRSAMSMVLPAGAAMSAAFAVQQYRRHGASTATAATTMLLSGAASATGLVLLYVGTVGSTELSRLGDGRLIAGIAVGCLVAGLLTWALRRMPSAVVPVRLTRGVSAVAAQVGPLWRKTRGISARALLTTVALAVTNWLLDLACFIIVAHAVGLPGSWRQLAAVHLAVQVVRQIPLTPGGIGLIEASLFTGLLATGAEESTATAVVVGYRLVSFWLILPAGLLAYLKLTRNRALPGPATDAAPVRPREDIAGSVPGRDGASTVRRRLNRGHFPVRPALMDVPISRESRPRTGPAGSRHRKGCPRPARR